MENCLPNSLVAPPQSHDPLSRRSPTNPTHFYRNASQSRRGHHNVVAQSQVVTNTVDFTREYNFSTYPSPLQRAALAVLQEFDNQATLAWLTALRLSRHDENYWFHLGGLSSEQLEAIAMLEDCQDNLVSAWLDFTRSGGAIDGPQRLSGTTHIDSESASTALLHSSWQGSSNTSRSSGGSFRAPSSQYDCNTVPTTPTSSRSRETFLDLSTEPSIEEATQPLPNSHSHWCFICPNPRLITTCDGWKRHMKEHETRYRCMPKGPIEYTAGGALCAFCGFRNPSLRHCETHMAFPCANRALDVRSYTRKPHFITHLKTHDVSNLSEFADRWRDTSDKKHFSCGFCVSHFHSLVEQLNHIDTTHYRLLQDIRDWDPNKVVRGLLLQPGVFGSWQRILASHPGLVESSLRWDLAVIKKIKARLEVGNECADVLAEMAFNESEYGSNRYGEAETVNPAGLSHHGGVAAPQLIPLTPSSAPIHFDLNESSAIDRDMMTYPASRMEQLGTWAVPNQLIPPHNYFLPRGSSDVSEKNPGIEVHRSDLDPTERLMTSGNSDWTQPERSLLTSWTSSRTLHSNLEDSDGVMKGKHWQADPILSPSNSSSLVSSQPGYQIQHRVRRAPPTRHTSREVPPASVQQVLPMTRSSAAFAKPSLMSQPRRQPSRSKLKDHYDINTEADIDLDMDFLQHFMREEDSTRSGMPSH